MKQPKFIITDRGTLRLGMVVLHKDLLQAGETCYGGGYYEFDYVSNRLILSGTSMDFGLPRWDLIDTLIVPKVYEGLRIVYIPKAPEDDFLVSDELLVTYEE